MLLIRPEPLGELLKDCEKPEGRMRSDGFPQ